MVGSVLTRSSSMTRGLVRARYAFALRANPAPEARDAFSGVSVVLTVAVTRSVWQLAGCAALVVRPGPGHGTVEGNCHVPASAGKLRAALGAHRCWPLNIIPRRRPRPGPAVCAV